MKNLMLLIAMCLLGTAGFAQLNCSTVNASISTSVSGGTVTLTNSSTPTSTSNIYTNYTIHWGDNSVTYAGTNASQTHTYNTSGTYNIVMYSQVLDSINNILCYDTASATVNITTSLNCSNVHSNFYVYRSNNSGVLVNQSVPVAGPGLGVQYHINWGDNNTTTTSSKANQVHPYTSGGTYNVTLIVTVIDSNNNITCYDTTTKSLYIPNPGTLNCNNVKSQFVTNSNLGNVNLANYSTPNITSAITASFNINWGDGNSTTVNSKASQNHTYTSSGGYTITMIATYTDGTITCVDTAQDTVSINTTPPNVISGYVEVDSTTMQGRDTFKVWLIKKQGNILSAVDSAIVSGYVWVPYHFNNAASGTYRVKAHHLNGPTSGQGYVPTYHDSALLWSNAQTINHTGVTSANNNIYMKKGTVTTGPGFVGGNVQQGANKGTANGIEGMNIFLFDNNYNLISYVATDVNGDYSFDDVPNGIYYVHPEQLAYTTMAAKITVDASKPSHKLVNFERSIKNQTISYKPTGIGNIAAGEVFSIYPNPASSVVNVVWADATGEDAVISITDLSGKQVVNTTVKMNGVTTLDVSQLQTGFYMLNVTDGNSSYTQKLILQ